MTDNYDYDCGRIQPEPKNRTNFFFFSKKFLLLDIRPGRDPNCQWDSHPPFGRSIQTSADLHRQTVLTVEFLGRVGRNLHDGRFRSGPIVSHADDPGGRSYMRFNPCNLTRGERLWIVMLSKIH